MDQRARDRIDTLLSGATNRGDVPGVVAAVADRNGILYEGAFGRSSLGGDAPMRMDSVFAIASMTKAVTAVAAMQLIEQGRMTLDQPAATIIPQLAVPMVLEGFDADGNPQQRPARTAITVRHLLTHTAGMAYANWNPLLRRYCDANAIPPTNSGKLAAFTVPLIADPGTHWEYSISIDWLGRIVEAISGEALDAYLDAHIFVPLGMAETGHRIRPGQEARLAGLHRRNPDGTLRTDVLAPPATVEFVPGGGGLHSTAHDYITFMRMLLSGGRLGDAVILRPETVALMGQNHTGTLPSVGILRTANPAMSHDLDPFPGIATHWGLSFLINAVPLPTGRSAGSLAWAGLRNTYYWLDPTRGLAGLLMTQILPFADPVVLRLLSEFETATYQS